jgi:hypothetical protein
MILAMDVVTLLYYGLVGYVSLLLLVNFARSRDWQKELLYVIVLVPFLLRLLRLK